MGNGCKSWPGVTKDGVAPSFRIELDVPVTEVADSDVLVNGITGLGTLGLSVTDDEMAVLSRPVVNGDTNGKLVLNVAVERDCVEALFAIKVVDESDPTAEAWLGSAEDCIFRVPRLKGGNKGEGDSNIDEGGKLEDPEGKDALTAGYCIVCCMEGGIDNPGGGRSKDCCWACNPGDP